MQAFQVFLLSAAISAGIIFFFLRSRVANLALDHIDRPQTMHSEVVPRIGGIAMSLAMFAALILYVENVADDLALVAIFLGSICVVVVSAIDDFRSLSPAIRLSIHTLLGRLVVWSILGNWLRCDGNRRCVCQRSPTCGDLCDGFRCRVGLSSVELSNRACLHGG